MQSNIIIYSNKLDETEFLRSLSLKGVSSFNYKVFNFKDLLIESSLKLGKFMNGQLINRDNALTLLESFINDNNIYKFTSFNDVKHIYKILNEARKNIIEDDELDYYKTKVIDVDKDNKNAQILFFIFQKYLNKLNERNLYDEISLARNIIKENKKLFNNIVVLREEKLTPLEEKLLNVIANVNQKYLSELYGVTYKENKKINNISNYFGEQTEVESTLSNIVKSKSHLDEVLILLADTSKYVHLLKELGHIYDIKMSFECGEPIYFSNPYKVYKTLNSLEDDYFFDVRGYKKLFDTDSFKLNELIDIKNKNNVAELLGRLKISFDNNLNEKRIFDFKSIKKEYKDTFYNKIDFKHSDRVFNSENDVFKVAKEFNKGKDYIIDKYSYVFEDGNKFDEAAKDLIIDYLITSNNLHNKEFKQSYLDQIDTLFINRKKFKSGTLHIATIDQGLSTIRKKVYILGLNANNFPGNPKEDYLLNDKDFELLTNKKNRSEAIINDKKEFLNILINNYNALGVEINLSFSAKDIKEVKDVNPSSVIYEYLNDNPSIKLKDDITQHDNDLSPLKNITNKFIKNKICKTNKTIQQTAEINSNLLDKAYSPSRIEKFIECPLAFYLSSILYADKEEDLDYLNNIPANTFGDIFHFTIETYVKNKNKIDTEEKFIALADDIFHSYEKLSVPFVKNETEYIRYMNGCHHTYQKLKNYRIIDSEFKVDEENAQKLYGVKFKGSIDLILEDKYTNEIIIFDHKTGRKSSHLSNKEKTKEDPFYKDIQGIIYANLYKKVHPDKEIGKVVFYYNCLDQEYVYLNPLDEETNKKLENLLTVFVDSLKKNNFGNESIVGIKDKERCKNCNFNNICKRGM